MDALKRMGDEMEQRAAKRQCVRHRQLKPYQVLRVYYQHWMPFSALCELFAMPSTLQAYGMKPEDLLERREFVFGFEGDVPQRWLTFSHPDQLRAKASHSAPRRMEVVAAHRNVPSKENRSELAKELVFDIDANDIDRLRGCACRGGKTICPGCWKVLLIGAKVLEYMARIVWKYESIMWVFSGRRGLHMWVFDPKAVTMSKGQRERLVERIALPNQLLAPLLTQEGFLNRVGATPEFEKREDALFATEPYCTLYTQILKPALAKLLRDKYDVFFQDPTILSPAVTTGNFLPGGVNLLFMSACVSLIADPQSPGIDIYSRYERTWRSETGSLGTSYSEVKRLVQEVAVVQEQDPDVAWERVNRRLAFLLMPVLDEKVTTGLMHALKVPFSPHPATGFVSCPVNIYDDAWHPFKQDAVPTPLELYHNTVNKKLTPQADAMNKGVKFLWSIVKKVRVQRAQETARIRDMTASITARLSKKEQRKQVPTVPQFLNKSLFS